MTLQGISTVKSHVSTAGPDCVILQHVQCRQDTGRHKHRQTGTQRQPAGDM